MEVKRPVVKPAQPPGAQTEGPACGLFLFFLSDQLRKRIKHPLLRDAQNAAHAPPRVAVAALSISSCRTRRFVFPAELQVKRALLLSCLGIKPEARTSRGARTSPGRPSE